MLELSLGSLQTVLYGLLTAWLVWIGRSHQLLGQPAWRASWAGFTLLLLASLFELAGTAISSSAAGPPHDILLFVAMLGYMAGGLLLAWGVWRWAPGIVELLATHRQLCGENSTHCDAPVRAGELQRMNARLEWEMQKRKRVESSLLQEKDRKLVTLQAISDGVITLDMQGTVDYINPAATRLTTWRAEDAIGQRYQDVLLLLDVQSKETLGNLISMCLLQECKQAHTDDALLLHKDGSEFNVNISVASLRDAAGHVNGVALVLHDLTEVMGIARQLGYQASHDMLTGLLNRREFERVLESAIRNVRGASTQYVMFYIDLDQFKLINDGCGHRAGDQLLFRLASDIGSLLREQDLLARLGGDEFGILLEGCGLDKALAVAEKIQGMLHEFRFSCQEKTFEIAASIGVVAINQMMRRFTDIMAAADIACYVAKEKGRNRIHVYSTDDKEVVQHHGEMNWVHRISQAFEDDRFLLYAQPIVPVQGGVASHAHYEILIRMQDGQGSLIAPAEFIPAAERYNLMPSIDRWVIRTTLGLLRQAQGPHDHPPIRCSINLSGQSLGDEHFLEFIIEQFHEVDVLPEYICFEITETAAISNLAMAMKLIETLRGMGCRFSLDDFGTGVSSLTYLKNLNIDYLKIDGSFIRDIVHDVVDYTMVESINQIAHIMGLKTIAEFVENRAVVEALQALQVDYLQGYAIGHPEPLETVLERLEWTAASGNIGVFQ